MTHRCFAAVDLPADFRRDLSEALQQLRQIDADVKWVETENLHITVRFFGPVTVEQIERIEAGLQNSSLSAAPFQIGLGSAGGFPDLRRPEVLWAGIARGSAELAHLAAAVAASSPSAGREQSFHPHLTLGRVRGRKHLKPLIQALAAADFSSIGSFAAGELVLFESSLGSDRPRYRPIRKWPLKAGSTAWPSSSPGM